MKRGEDLFFGGRGGCSLVGVLVANHTTLSIGKSGIRPVRSLTTALTCKGVELNWLRHRSLYHLVGLVIEIVQIKSRNQYDLVGLV